MEEGPAAEDSAPTSMRCRTDSPCSLQSQLEYWREMALTLQKKLQHPVPAASSKATPETALSTASRRSESSSEVDNIAGHEDSETTVADGQRELAGDQQKLP